MVRSRGRLSRHVSSPHYTGEVLPDRMSDGLDPYLPDPELVDAVNLAIFLQKRPLLLKGDPGCGKTRLARMVAFELQLDYQEWHVKSTSRARDGLYTYDAVARLQDAQLAGRDEEAAKRVGNPSAYLTPGPLMKAFLSGRQTVVLIDEIDKADIDFPNDLLLELDEQRFLIEETGEVIVARHRPLVFITSNDEKDLPDAFLRRCLFHHIQFPDAKQLRRIVMAHFPDASAELIGEAEDRFRRLRDKMERHRGRAGKRVSTSELLDWFAVLRRDPEKARQALAGDGLPYPQVLLKSWEDHLHYLRQTVEDEDDSP